MDLLVYVQAEMVKALMTGAKTIVVPAALFNTASEANKEAARNMCQAAGATLVVQ